MGQLAAAAVTPIVMMHGPGDFANNPMGMLPLRRMIEKQTGAYVHSAELCSHAANLTACEAEDQVNSILSSVTEQVRQFNRVVSGDPKLAGGFNAIGFSGGNLVIRGYIEKYNSPPVKTFISLHGPMMGFSAIPPCYENATNGDGMAEICKVVNYELQIGMYSSYVQENLAFANYFRDPMNLANFRQWTQFLPDLNNEATQNPKSPSYNTNFASIEKLVLVMAQNDTLIVPKESQHFGYFQEGSNSSVLSMRDSQWYTEDWFGLKALDNANKIVFNITAGNHLQFTMTEFENLIGEYFLPQIATAATFV